MTNTIPTPAEAIAYIRKIEASWGVAPFTDYCCRTSIDEDSMSVTTPNYCWNVWYQPDGTLYGEA